MTRANVLAETVRERDAALAEVERLRGKLTDQCEQIVGLRSERNDLTQRNRDLNDEIEIDMRDIKALQADRGVLEARLAALTPIVRALLAYQRVPTPVSAGDLAWLWGAVEVAIDTLPDAIKAELEEGE